MSNVCYANLGTTVSTVSWIFTARSASFFAGAASSTPSFKYVNPLLAVTICVWGIAICLGSGVNVQSDSFNSPDY